MSKDTYANKRPKNVICPHCQANIRVSQGWGDPLFFVIFFSLAGIVALFLKKSVQDAFIYMTIFFTISLVMIIVTIYKYLKPSNKTFLKENCSSCGSIIHIEYKKGSLGVLEWTTSISKTHTEKKPAPTGSEKIIKSTYRQRSLFSDDNRVGRVTQSETVVFIRRLITAGFLSFLGTAVVVGFLFYAFGIRDNPDWSVEPGLYRFIGYVYFLAGIVSANTCGRYTRNTYGRSFTPIVISAIAVTLLMELVIWSTFIPVETFIRAEFLSLPPNKSHELSGLWLFAALCTVGWIPVFEKRD